MIDRFEQTTWKPLAKDGATLPAGQIAPRPARQLVTVGETYEPVIPARAAVAELGDDRVDHARAILL